MTIFDYLLINILLVTVPFCFYFLYLVYTKTLQKEKKDLFFTFAIVSSFYCILKMKNVDYFIIPLTIINVPLFISYMYGQKSMIFLLSFGISFYYSTYLDISIYIFFVIYILYYILYLILHKKHNTLLMISSFFMLFFLTNSLETNILFHIALLIILFIIIHFLLFLFDKMEQIVLLHNTTQQIEIDQKMYESLFKITHEIKNPIAVIKGYLDMFDIHNQNHALKYIPIMKGEVNRVLLLLEDFLSIKRLKIQKEIMDISLLIEEVIDSFKPLLESKKIGISFDADEIYIEGDYNRLKQVMINLVKNSIEAMKENGMIKIHILKGKKTISIDVIDNGCGMSIEELEKINYPFFTTKPNGTGLGVYLSREIIKKHNGSMNYTSKGGVKVTVKLPYEARLN